MLARAPFPDLSATPWRRINLSTTQDIWCLVDAADYDWLIETNWNWGWHAKTRWKHYAKRNIGRARSTVYMHREILLRVMPLSEADRAEKVGDHINGQSLDNRRVNLRWATTAENNVNRFGRYGAPTLESILADLLRAPEALAADIPF